MVDFIEFEDMIVAAHEHGLMRRVMDQVVRGPIAHAFKGEPISGGELVLRKPPDMVIEASWPAGTSVFRSPAAEHQAALAGVMDIAGQYAMPGSAGDANAQATQVAHIASRDLAVAAARHVDAVVQTGFDDKAPQE